MNLLVAGSRPLSSSSLLSCSACKCPFGLQSGPWISCLPKFRGISLVLCPEPHKPAGVEAAARSLGLQAILYDPCLHLSECLCWPTRQDCGQNC